MKTLGGFQRSRCREWSGRDWQDTWSLRPTTWCEWLTSRHERSPGSSNQRDCLGRWCAPKCGGRASMRPTHHPQAACRDPKYKATSPPNIVTGSINQPCRTGKLVFLRPVNDISSR